MLNTKCLDVFSLQATAVDRCVFYPEQYTVSLTSQDRKTNVFVQFLGESAACQSVYGSIWPLMGGYFFVEKNSWDKIILGLKNSRGIGQVSVQFSKWHAILSRSNSWQCNWLECALLHTRVPCFLPYLLKIVKRKETHKMWYWYLCQKLFLP